MRLIDFDDYLLHDWIAADIPCDLSSVSLLLMAAFQKLPFVRRVRFLSVVRENSKNHRDGFAGDYYLVGVPVDTQTIVKEMLDAGFRGIGVYWNGTKHSFHGDVLPGKLRFWRATKGLGNKWVYGGLICDPKTWPVT